MIEAIKEFLVDTVGRELAVFICAMLPVIELRGAIPLGASLGMQWLPNFLISLAGTFLPVPFILFFIRAIIGWMKKVKWLAPIALWLEKRADKKKGIIEKAEFFGLLLFVAIPLPGTGAWTGSLIAALMMIEKKKAMLSVFLGSVAAGIIMTVISYGIKGLFA